MMNHHEMSEVNLAKSVMRLAADLQIEVELLLKEVHYLRAEVLRAWTKYPTLIDQEGVEYLCRTSEEEKDLPK